MIQSTVNVIGAHLLQFACLWLGITTNAWIREIVQKGYYG